MAGGTMSIEVQVWAIALCVGVVLLAISVAIL